MPKTGEPEFTSLRKIFTKSLAPGNRKQSCVRTPTASDLSLCILWRKNQEIVPTFSADIPSPNISSPAATASINAVRVDVTIGTLVNYRRKM